MYLHSVFSSNHEVINLTMNTKTRGCGLKPQMKNSNKTRRHKISIVCNQFLCYLWQGYRLHLTSFQRDRTFRRRTFRRRTFRRRTFRRTDTSPYGHFAVRTLRRKDISPWGHFAGRTLRRKDTSPWDFLPYGHFAVNYFFITLQTVVDCILFW